MTEDKRKKGIYRVTLWGSLGNAILIVFKFVAGILGNSSAMIADAIHSVTDFVTDVVILFFVNIASKPEDKDHAYGHGKYETLATTIVGLVLLGVGFGVFYSGISKIIDVVVYNETLESPRIIALCAAIVSIVVKEFLFRYTRAAGKKMSSQLLLANAWHHRSDAFTSLATMAGIAGAILLGNRWAILDPVAAVVVSFFIVKMAIKLMLPALGELLEKSLPAHTEQRIIEIVNSVDGVIDPHNLKTRKIGSIVAIELHIRVKRELSVLNAHIIATDVEYRLKEEFGQNSHVNIHIEPEK